MELEKGATSAAAGPMKTLVPKELLDEFGAIDIHLPKVQHPFQATLYGDMVRAGFSKLYQDEALSDITLIMAGDRIPAHKIVLCVWSDRFDISGPELTLEVDLADKDIFKLMLRHMYTGETDFINKENIMGLIRLCFTYGIDTLKETCGELLGALVSDDNLFFLLDIVDKYKVKQLEAACGEHLADNFGTLLEEDKLIDLEPSTWAEMLRSDDLRIRSEEQLFEAVMRYANTRYKSDKEARERALTTILPFVRFPYLSPKFIMKNVEGDKTISDLPVVHELLHETYRYKVYPSSVKTIRTRPRKGFIFDEEQTGAGLTLSEDKTKVTLTTGGTWVNARSMHPLSADSDYCEFKIEYGTASQIMVGIVQGVCSNTGYAGQYHNGWSYYSAGQIYHAGSTLASVGQQYSTNDVIGMHLDFEKGTLTFYRNGTETCHADGLPVKTDSTGFYPIVSINSVPNSVSLVSRPTYPEVLQAKCGKKQKTRAPKTYRVGNDLGESSTISSETDSASAEAAPHKPSDPTAFIKRFLKF